MNHENYYTNPILYSDYSDPDVVRAGDKYIMVSSSFNCLPGIPILVSEDLVNWEIKNHAVKNLPFEEFDKPVHANGIWAPSIRFHNNKYWIFFGMPDHGIFMINAEDPLGDWSEPICVKAVKGWIDPCPLWDDDGKAYLVSALAKSRAGVNSKLILSKMNPEGTKIEDEGTIIFDGTENHPTIEGPKFYKKDGLYYILAPAGGVPTGWQTVLRSENIYGPYEDKIVLHQGTTETNGPHQGGLVDDEKGNSWFIHFQDAGVYGRITHLQPVTWKDGWPLMGEYINEEGTGEPVKCWKMPKYGRKQKELKKVPKNVLKDHFNKNDLALQWQWFANPKENFFSLDSRKGIMRLFTIANGEGIWNTPNLLLQKFPYPGFEAKTSMKFKPEIEGDIAGMIVMGEQYSALILEKQEGEYTLKHIVSYDDKNQKKEKILEEIKIFTNKIYFKVREKESGECEFFYSLEGDKYKPLRNKIKIKNSTWIGGKIGIFTINKLGKSSTGFADYEYFILS